MRIILATLALIVTLPLQAHESQLAYNRVSFSVSAQREVDNDILVAALYAQQEGSDVTQLAREVNRAIAAAVDKAKAIPSIKVETLDYSTNPVYRKQKITAWRVRQSMRLESSDAGKLSQLVAELQQSLNLGSVRYQLSPSARRVVEDKLITEAIERFQARVRLIGIEMGQKPLKLVQMKINTSRRTPQPRMYAAQARLAEPAAPKLEAGQQNVTVHIDGTIELQ